MVRAKTGRTATTRHRWAALAVAASLSATAAVATPRPAGATAGPRVGEAQPALVPLGELPALASSPAPTPPPERPERVFAGLDDVAPNPVELDALNRTAKPSAFDPARSTPVDAETTPTRRVFSNSDGSRTAQLNTRPVRFRDPAAGGAWRDFDLTPVPAGDGTLVARSAPGAARLAGRAGGVVATVETSAGPTKVVTAANLGIYNWYSPSCAPSQVDAYGLAGSFSDATTWNTQPATSGPVVASASFAHGASGCVPDWASSTSPPWRGAGWPTAPPTTG